MVATFMVHYMLQSTLVRRPMNPLGGGWDTQRQKLFWMPMTRSDQRVSCVMMSPEKTKPTSQEKKASHIPKEGLEEVVSFDCDCCSDWNSG